MEYVTSPHDQVFSGWGIICAGELRIIKCMHSARRQEIPTAGAHSHMMISASKKSHHAAANSFQRKTENKTRKCFFCTQNSTGMSSLRSQQTEIRDDMQNIPAGFGENVA